MTEKERHQAFNDPDNWTPSVEFPSNGFIRVLAFEFYSMTFYKLQIYTHVFHWEDEKYRGKYVSEWETKFYFSRIEDYLVVENMSKIWKYMKIADEMENGIGQKGGKK